MLDFETASAMSREILRNHDRYTAHSRRQLVGGGMSLQQLGRHLRTLPARVALVINRIMRRT